MSNTIKLKRASSSDPGASDLATGELAIRTSNCKLFSKNDSGSAIGIVAGSADTLTTARTIAGVSFNGSANISLNNNAITNGAGYITDVVSDTSPQLGGNLDCNNKVVTLNDSSGSDNNRIKIGNAGDLQIYHDGSHSYLEDAGTGNLRLLSNNAILANANTFTVNNGANDENMITAVNGGAVELYHNNVKQIQTTSDGVGFINNCTFSDNKKIQMGASNDLQIYHDGSNSYIRETGTGSIFIEGNSNIYIGKASGGAENGIVVKPDGAVDLYHDNSKKFETTSSGATVTGALTATDGFISEGGVVFTGANYNANWVKASDLLRFQDNAKAAFGASDDLKIFHNGSDSILQDTGTGSLILISNAFKVKNAANNEAMIYANEDGAVELYHNNSKKFETSSSGGTVTGTLVATAFTGPLTGNVTGNASGSSGSCTGNAATASNAATLDGIDSSQFLRSDAADTASSELTLSGGILLTGKCGASITALSDGSTITINMASNTHHNVTLGGNRTFAAPSNQNVGQSGSIFISQDSTGSRTASFNSAFKFAGGTAPTLSTAASSVDRIDYVIKTTNVIHCAFTADVK